MAETKRQLLVRPEDLMLFLLLLLFRSSAGNRIPAIWPVVILTELSRLTGNTLRQPQALNGIWVSCNGD